ncbi:hypothetical protein KFK09_008826 [Dendrobium nobile]|uniref:Uncharacterized protein n=1 Tax=Dendrobium nobile TaxID=94219 RepID=A0A8T3BL63_DENNO|nr:hypothetical protein KFK09_008826 [Dendrobium nobile]
MGRLSYCFLKQFFGTNFLIFILESRFKNKKESHPKLSLRLLWDNFLTAFYNTKFSLKATKNNS